MATEFRVIYLPAGEILPDAAPIWRWFWFRGSAIDEMVDIVRTGVLNHTCLSTISDELSEGYL